MRLEERGREEGRGQDRRRVGGTHALPFCLARIMTVRLRESSSAGDPRNQQRFVSLRTGNIFNRILCI